MRSFDYGKNLMEMSKNSRQWNSDENGNYVFMNMVFWAVPMSL